MGRHKSTTAVDRPKWQNVDVVPNKTGYFPPPDSLSEDALEVWDTFWSDSVSNIAAVVDKSVIIRWILNTDRYFKMMAKFDEMPFIYTTRGDPEINPSFKIADALLRVINKDEQQLGIGPRNRVNIGMTLATTERTIREINNDYDGRKDGSDNDKPVRADPRNRRIIGRAEV